MQCERGTEMTLFAYGSCLYVLNLMKMVRKLLLSQAFFFFNSVVC